MKLLGLILLSTSLMAQSLNHQLIKENLNIFPEKLQSDILSRINTVKDFQDFSPSFRASEKERFNRHIKEYKYDFPIEQVWDAYRNAGPNEVWAGPRVFFGFIYDKNTDKIHFNTDKYLPKLEVGMVIFNHLSVLRLTKMNVSFEITKIDDVNKILQFSYLNCNTSAGQQTLKFVADGNKTIVKHISYFKNESKLRDKLYPPVHTLLINEHHANMKTIINN